MSSQQYWCYSVQSPFGCIWCYRGKLKNKMQQHDIDKMEYILLRHICVDIINGTLLTQTNSDELQMILTEMYDDMSSYEAMGVTLGKA